MGYAADIAEKLADRAETVCETYLPNGSRRGAWYVAGDVYGAKGGSLIVRLKGDRRRIGRWKDTNPARADHRGNLLNLIQLTRGLTLYEAIREAEALIDGASVKAPSSAADALDLSDEAKRERAQKLFGKSVQIDGTAAARYLASRGLGATRLKALRFHRNAYYQDDNEELRSGPAMIAAIRNAAGDLLAVHRTWFDKSGVIMRKMMGPPGDGFVDLGGDGRTVLVGEGIETVLSFRGVFSGVRLQAVLTASRLAHFEPPEGVDCILIAVDRDAAGLAAARSIQSVARARGIASRFLLPRSRFSGADFNDDLRSYGFDALSAHVRGQAGLSAFAA